jgi:putative acetyltransferase
MSAEAHPKLALRPFLPADAPLTAEIFRAAIEELTGDDYSASQQEAWAAAADDVEAFGARLAADLTLLGTLDGSPVGFASLKDNERVDMLYVHPAAAGHGVGSLLIDALEKLATARGARRLTADVSDSAETFFKQRGFVPQQRNSVPFGD